MTLENLPAGDGGTRPPAVLTGPGAGTAARTTVRLAATLLVAGVVVSLAAGVFHADSLDRRDFSAANSVPTLSGIALTVVWTVWLLISAWRMKDGPAPGQRSR
ncbi:hypothetical protein [Pseudarthrobacter sp. H2]|uniref:hypothetical protein n=1 Tax=Pseudarthrobacter sp. H2 TaxID=3418415 RepID=UPI003CF8F2E9